MTPLGISHRYAESVGSRLNCAYATILQRTGVLYRLCQFMGVLAKTSLDYVISFEGWRRAWVRACWINSLWSPISRTIFSVRPAWVASPVPH